MWISLLWFFKKFHKFALYGFWAILAKNSHKANIWLMRIFSEPKVALGKDPLYKTPQPKGHYCVRNTQSLCAFAEALSLPSSIFWAGNQCGIAAASYSLMMNMWRPWNVGAFISHPPQLTICQSQRMPFLSFSVQALVPTCLLLLPAACYLYLYI